MPEWGIRLFFSSKNENISPFKRRVMIALGRTILWNNRDISTDVNTYYGTDRLSTMSFEQKWARERHTKRFLPDHSLFRYVISLQQFFHYVIISLWKPAYYCRMMHALNEDKSISHSRGELWAILGRMILGNKKNIYLKRCDGRTLIEWSVTFEQMG